MIDDMLFLAKADNGLIIPQQAPIALADLAAKLFEFYQLLAEEQGIQLAVSGSGEVRGDPLMLERAISNLLANALRYTPSGETIHLSIRQAASLTAVSIENPGSTIPPEHLQKLFDRFYRADPARREGNASNAGLGLAITRSIVEAHKGRIWCTSSDGLTGFHMEFPRQSS
jgi:two-component system heavy metal sensor histidine kinase CusS